MKTSHGSLASMLCMACLLLNFVPASGPEDEIHKTVDELTRIALQAKADGSADYRQLLAVALEKSPGHPLARWHSGCIQQGRRWTQIDDLIKRRRDNLQLVAYRVQRERLWQNESLTPSMRHRQLAAWCAERGLVQQRQAHLVSLLQFDPDNGRVRQQLGHVRVGGSWLDPREIQIARRRALRAAQELAVWRPRLFDLAHRLGGGEGSPQKRQMTRLSAVCDWQALEDPAAIPAMEVEYSSRPIPIMPTPRSRRPPSPEITAQLEAQRKAHLASLEYYPCAVMVIEKLGQMQSREAAVSLARHAVLCGDPSIRHFATDRLKGRSLDDYVPVLLSALATPFQTRAQLYTTPDGRLLYRQMYYREGPSRRELAVFDTVFGYEDTGRGDPRIALSQAVGRARRSESEARRRTSAQADGANALNTRVCDVLAEATGVQMESSPENWWRWWNDYNEVFVEGQKPLVQGYRQREVAVQGIVATPRPGPRPPQIVSPTLALRIECLAAGTPIWTERGPCPIELIQIGDLVFSQHPDTGELALKPVLRTTRRDPGPVLNIDVSAESGDETIVASGGHQFWRAGHGWTRSRELANDQRFHGLVGPAHVDSVQPGDAQATHNLIVADFHTYFVGDAKILSHDNTTARPTKAVVPGYQEP